MSGKEIVKQDDVGQSITRLSDSIDKHSNVKSFKKSCKLYNSKYRKVAEDKFDECGNISAVHRFLKEKGEQISRQAVSRYFNNYYYIEANAQALKDYMEDLKLFVDVKQSKENRLITQMAVNDKLIFEIAANTPVANMTALSKAADTIVKLQNMQLSIQKQIDEHDEEMKPVHILIDRFKNLIKIQMNNVKSKDAQQAMIEIVQKLQKEVEDI